MDNRVHKELLVQKDHHAVHGSQDLDLYSRRPVRFAKANQRAQYVLTRAEPLMRQSPMRISLNMLTILEQKFHT